MCTSRIHPLSPSLSLSPLLPGCVRSFAESYRSLALCVPRVHKARLSMQLDGASDASSQERRRVARGGGYEGGRRRWRREPLRIRWPTIYIWRSKRHNPSANWRLSNAPQWRETNRDAASRRAELRNAREPFFSLFYFLFFCFSRFARAPAHYLPIFPRFRSSGPLLARIFDAYARKISAGGWSNPKFLM